MRNTGIVIEKTEDNVKLRFIRESACGGNCASCGGCSSKPIEVTVKNTLDARVGDKVEVESDTKKILTLAFILYILPLIVLISVYSIAIMFFEEKTSLIICIIAFFISFTGIKAYGNKFKNEAIMIRIKKEN